MWIIHTLEAYMKEEVEDMCRVEGEEEAKKKKKCRQLNGWTSRSDLHNYWH